VSALPAMANRADTQVRPCENSLSFQILLRRWILLVLALPKDRHDQPALAVVHQLNAIYAALKGARIVGAVARFVGTEDVRDLAEYFNLARRLAFVESLLFKSCACPLNVFINC